MRSAALISAVALLGACSVQPQASRDLRLDLPDTYSVVAPVTQPKQENLEWWRNFNDPVLNSLIARGLSGNLNVAEARARLREAEANARSAKGSIVTGNGDLGVRSPRNFPDIGEVRLTAEVNLAGRDFRRAEAALSRLEAARFDEGEARRIVITEVAVTYLNLRYQQQLLRTRNQDLATRQRISSDVEEQFKVGSATRLDQLRTTSLVSETKVEIPQIENEIIRQRNRLSTLLGVPVGALGVDLGYPGRQPFPVRAADVGVPVDLLRARPDIQAAERQYAAAISDMDAAQAARYPSLSLSGLLNAPLSGGASSSTLLAGLILPVFDQPALAAEVDAAQARANQAYLRWRVAVLQAVEEVETAQSSLRTSLNARNAAQDVVSINQEALELSRDMLNTAGSITVLDVVDRERTLSASRAVLARSNLDTGTSYVDLMSALGQGHSVTREPIDTVVVPENAASQDQS